MGGSAGVLLKKLPGSWGRRQRYSPIGGSWLGVQLSLGVSAGLLILVTAVLALVTLGAAPRGPGLAPKDA